MTPLVAHSQTNKPQLGWLAALLGALALHGACAWYFFFQSELQLAFAPQAAPQVFEISTVAAPVAPATELPIDRMQQESAPTPQQRSEVKVEQTPKPEPVPKVEATQSDIELATSEEWEEPEVEEEQEPEKLEPVAEEKPQPAQEHDSAGDDSAEQYVEQSSAPLSLETQPAEVASAPQQGALSQQQTQAKMNWQNRLQAHLERRKRYPRSARMRYQQGVPWVRFSMNRQGEVLSVELHRASGVVALDREVLALVKRAEPLPLPPAEVEGEVITMAVPVEFFIQ